MTKQIGRRIFADVVGCLALALLAVAVILCVASLEAVLNNLVQVAALLLIYVAVGYFTWIRIEKITTNWRLGVGVMVAIATVSFAIDIVNGLLAHPELGLIKGAVSTGLSFGITLCIVAIVPIFLSGWLRGLVLRGFT